MREFGRSLFWVAVVWLLSGCDYEPQPSTGGTDIAPGPFGRGLTVIDTDYQSTNTSLVGLDGAVLSPSFIGTAQSKMSWDIQAPTMPSTGDDVVFLDRAFGIVTWVDVHTARIRAQFHADDDELARNPWDYLPISPEKAYVTRYDPWPGNSVHGDLIVVNPQTASVTSHIDKRIEIGPALGLPGKFLVRPARGVVIGDRAYITTVNVTMFYKEYTASFLVVLDTKTDELVGVKELTDLDDCTGIAVSPSKTELAIICSGDLHANSTNEQARSAIVLLSPEDLSEKKRIAASKLAAGPLAFSLSYAAERSLLYTAYGNGTDDLDDVAGVVDLDTDESQEIHRAGPIQIGAVLCPARVDGAKDGLDPEACFVTDADDFTVVRFPVESGSIGAPDAIKVDEGRGRPPRYLGQF